MNLDTLRNKLKQKMPQPDVHYIQVHETPSGVVAEGGTYRNVFGNMQEAKKALAGPEFNAVFYTVRPKVK